MKERAVAGPRAQRRTFYVRGTQFVRMGLLAGVVVAVGCGGGGGEAGGGSGVTAEGPRLGLERWRGLVQRECRALGAKVDRINFFQQARPRTQGEDVPRDVVVERILGRIVPVIRGKLERIAALRPPAGADDDVNGFLADMDEIVDALETLPAVLRSDDPGAASALAARFDALARPIGEFVDEYRLPGCARAALLSGGAP